MTVVPLRVPCPLCAGHGRFDDIECPSCATVGTIPNPRRGVEAVDEVHRWGPREVSALEWIAAQSALSDAPASDREQAGYVAGYGVASRQRRRAVAAAAYARGVHDASRLQLERRRPAAAVAALFLSFAGGVAAAPTVYALLAGWSA